LIIQPTSDGVILAVRVIPRARRAGAAGMRDGALLVRLNAPPVDGAANAELIALLADALGVARSAVTIVTGQRGRSKRVRITGVSADHVASRLPH
jgi:uncharacterized protein